jgi:hypothetical protein
MHIALFGLNVKENEQKNTHTIISFKTDHKQIKDW